MKQENHLSIPLPSIYRGLETIFEEWRLPDSLGLYDKGGIEAIHKRFREAGTRFGYPERITPPFALSLVTAGSYHTRGVTVRVTSADLQPNCVVPPAQRSTVSSTVV